MGFRYLDERRFGFVKSNLTAILSLVYEKTSHLTQELLKNSTSPGLKAKASKSPTTFPISVLAQEIVEDLEPAFKGLPYLNHSS